MKWRGCKEAILIGSPERAKGREERKYEVERSRNSKVRPV
jgi:hypothetical protein